MKNSRKSTKVLNDLILRYPALSSSLEDMEKAADLILRTLKKGKKILICGNGGSSADADHIVGELMKGFRHKRPLSVKDKQALEVIDSNLGRTLADRLQQGYPALSLSSSTALNTAFINDVDASLVYAQQITGMGSKNDLLWCLSTSGNSENIAAAAITARAFGLTSLAMTGRESSRLSELCDVCINVDEVETYKVQELHLPVYHALCIIVEEHFHG